MRFVRAIWFVCIWCASQISVHAQTQPQAPKPNPRPQATQQKPKPAPVTVGGQVFVVTKGGWVVKNTGPALFFLGSSAPLLLGSSALRLFGSSAVSLSHHSHLHTAELDISGDT
jgi:hypothetical protein